MHLGPGARVEGVGKAPRTACWNSLFFPWGQEVASLGTQRSPRTCFLPLLVIGYVYYPPSKSSHQNIEHCVRFSLQATHCLILLELMSGGDMKSFLRHSWPHLVNLLPALYAPLKTLFMYPKTSLD